MKHLMLFFTVTLLSLSTSAQVVFKTDADIRVGARQYDQYRALLSGKRVAIVGNHTSVVDSVHLVDWLIEKGVEIVKVFAPEHGFRGEASAGEKVNDTRDAKTGLPVVSLYGSHKKPTAADLEGVDIVVFDIQDVGARFYTYISTMAYVMEACAEQQIPVVILDRPNPNGFYVDGPMLKPGFESFVGLLPIPVVHGMTVGELAKMINGEGWLEGGVRCVLHVVPCEGYTHRDCYVLPIKPSPNLPTQNAILLYPSLCFFEGTDFSVGRGTDFPFEVFGHPNMSSGAFMFVPASKAGATKPKHEGVPCLGWDLRQFGGANVMSKQYLVIEYLVNAYNAYPDKQAFFLKNNFIDKLAGSDQLRLQIQAGMTAEEIRASWQSDLIAFNLKRRAYLLYPDF